MDLSALNQVRPLNIIENNFLEVLVSNFTLKRSGQGSELKIQFKNNSPAICRRTAKTDLQQAMPDFKRKAVHYQKNLDAYLLESKGKEYIFNDSDFVFRYASGGTLPIIRINKKEYYCLMYREIFPIGWNIANGGCDTLLELLNPLDTIERELREELIIVDLENHRRYSFESDLGKPLDHPQFAIAHRFWKERFHWLNLPKFKEFPINLKWLEGPDSLSIEMDLGKESYHTTIKGCFLNINALDFGIEIDKVVKLNLDQEKPGIESNIVLLDGEIVENHLVNAVLGLFDINRLNKEILEGTTEFFPDFFFFNAKKWDAASLQEVLNKHFMPEAEKHGIVSKQETKEWMTYKNKYDLCPITRRIIKRNTSLHATTIDVGQGPFDVFLSFSEDDVEDAQKLFNFLSEKQIRTFFSRETIGDFNFHRVIDDAIDTAKYLVAVGTTPETFRRPWVEYECLAFHNNILSKRNSEGSIIPFISGFNPVLLPLPLRMYNSIVWDQRNIEPSFEELSKRILH